MKILSVDDSTPMRRIIGRVVAMLGYEFLEATNGEEGLAAAARNTSLRVRRAAKPGGLVSAGAPLFPSDGTLDLGTVG